MLAKLGEDTAVVIVDSLLTERDGRALCREIKERQPLVPVVVMAAKGEQGLEDTLAEADGLLVVPFGWSSFSRLVNELTSVSSTQHPASREDQSPLPNLSPTGRGTRKR